MQRRIHGFRVLAVAAVLASAVVFTSQGLFAQGDNHGACVSRCEELRKREFDRCMARDRLSADECAARANAVADRCKDRCRKECEAECEERRQAIFQRCTDSGRPANECAAEANDFAKQCKERRCNLER